MAPLKKNKKQANKRSYQDGQGAASKNSKKPKISIDSSDESDHEMRDLSSASQSSDEDELDELDELDKAGSDSEEDEENEAEENGDEESETKEGGSNNHDEQRKLLKERKMMRKSGAEVQHIKSLWEKLRVKNPPLPKPVREKLSNEIWDLSKDCISDLVLKHDASRVVQTLVKYSTKERREQIVNALQGKFYVLATSAYGKYLLVKLLHYGSKNSRQLIIDELHGKLRKLMRHREGAYVVEDLYVLYASHQQKQQMIREFWGSEYAVFKDAHKDLTINQVCETSIEKRNIIARNLLGTITASVEKGSTGFQILHAAMREFVKMANEKEITEMIELVHEQFAELVHTPEGADVACTLIARASAKERKLIIKTLKNHTESLIKNEHGNLVFTTALLCVDDTVLMFKSFGPSVKEHLSEFVIDKYARRPWLYIMLGLDGKYFAPNVLSELNRYIALSEATSKKPSLQRRHENLKRFAPMFIKCLSKNCSELLRQNLGCQFVSEVLVNDELYEQLDEKDLDSFAKLIENVIRTFQGDISEDEHPIQSPFSTRLLKSLIQGGKWNNKEKKVEPLQKVQGLGAAFAIKFFNEVIKSSDLIEWCNNPNSSFTIVALYETLKDEKEGKEFVKDLKKVVSQIDENNDENKGAKLLLKLVR